MSIQEVHARAVRASVDVVSSATVADLARPTPCAGWSLADLLAHIVAQHRGFAGAARGAVTQPEEWAPVPLGDAAVATYAQASADVLAAFAEDGVLEREFSIPEFSTRRPFPGLVAIEAHLVDSVVHGWDVARTLGAEFRLDPEVTGAAWRIASAIPDAARSPFFQPAVASGASASELDRIVALLGRSPSWPDA